MAVRRSLELDRAGGGCCTGTANLGEDTSCVESFQQCWRCGGGDKPKSVALHRRSSGGDSCGTTDVCSLLQNQSYPGRDPSRGPSALQAHSRRSRERLLFCSPASRILNSSNSLQHRRDSVNPVSCLRAERERCHHKSQFLSAPLCCSPASKFPGHDLHLLPPPLSLSEDTIRSQTFPIPSPFPIVALCRYSI